MALPETLGSPLEGLETPPPPAEPAWATLPPGGSR